MQRITSQTHPKRAVEDEYSDLLVFHEACHLHEAVVVLPIEYEWNISLYKKVSAAHAMDR